MVRHLDVEGNAVEVLQGLPAADGSVVFETAGFPEPVTRSARSAPSAPSLILSSAYRLPVAHRPAPGEEPSTNTRRAYLNRPRGNSLVGFDSKKMVGHPG